jgi:hypothetical protein
MIEKAKTDQPRSLEDTLLFAQGFYHISADDTYEVAKRIQALIQPREGWFGVRSVTSEVQSLQGRYAFDVRIKQRSRGIDYTVAKAVGQVYMADGVTILDGKVLLGAVWYGFMLFTLVFVFGFLLWGGFPPSIRWLFVLIVGGVMGYYLYSMFKAREELHQWMEHIAGLAPEKGKFSG